jgi:hypothetical protein
MSGPVQVFPPGLLGFLQLKNAGNNPSDLTDTIQTVIDARDWYFQARMLDALNLFGAVGTVNVNATGLVQFPVFTAPQTSWLYVDNFSATCALLAAEYIRAAPVLITFPGVTGQQQLQLGDDVNDIVTARARSWICRSGAFFMPPGSILGLKVFDVITAGNIAVTPMIKAALLPN